MFTGKGPLKAGAGEETGGWHLENRKGNRLRFWGSRGQNNFWHSFVLRFDIIRTRPLLIRTQGARFCFNKDCFFIPPALTPQTPLWSNYTPTPKGKKPGNHRTILDVKRLKTTGQVCSAGQRCKAQPASFNIIGLIIIIIKSLSLLYIIVGHFDVTVIRLCWGKNWLLAGREMGWDAEQKQKNNWPLDSRYTRPISINIILHSC